MSEKKRKEEAQTKSAEKGGRADERRKNETSIFMYVYILDLSQFPMQVEGLFCVYRSRQDSIVRASHLDLPALFRSVKKSM